MQERIVRLASGTKIVTCYGVVRIEEVRGTGALLLGHDGQWVRGSASPVGERAVHCVTLGRSGARKVVRAAVEHEWLTVTRRGCTRVVRTDELEAGQRLQYVFPTPSKVPRVERVAAARGFVFGDGSCNGRRTRSWANFCGDKDRALLPLFEGLGHPAREYGPITRIHGLPSSWKLEIPRYDDEVDLIYGWLAGYFSADGDVDKTGRPTLSSSVADNLEAVRMLCHAVGIGTFGIRRRTRKGYGAQATNLYLVGLMRGDLSPEFFLLPEHRRRFEHGATAVERRRWKVLACSESRSTVEVFEVRTSTAGGFALEDNVLI